MSRTVAQIAQRLGRQKIKKSRIAVKVVQAIQQKLAEEPWSDLSDVGNIVGMAVCKHSKAFTQDSIASFEIGFEHGKDLMLK